MIGIFNPESSFVKQYKLKKLARVLDRIDHDLFTELMNEAKEHKFEDIDMSKYSKFTKIASIDDVSKFMPVWGVKYRTAFGLKSLAEYQHEHKCW